MQNGRFDGCAEFEQKLAYHTAPALLGIKCANLISLGGTNAYLRSQTERFNAKAACKGLKMKMLCSCKSRMLIMLYNEKMLARRLSQPDCAEILERYGYGTGFTVDEALEKLARRIADSKDFPHEIGIFLGYPTQDVLGFIENNGQNFAFCGYWKVYSNEEKARRVFENYDKCRKFLCNKLNSGCDIYQALKIS
jgi:hypothetical protein